MPKLAIAVSALFLLGSASACGTSGSSDADSTTTTAVSSATTAVDDETTTTEGSGGGGDADDYVAAVAENLQSNSKEAGELTFDPEQADCVATEWVDIIGVDTLESNDVSPADVSGDNFQFTELGLDDEQAGDMIDAIAGCGVDGIGTLRELLDEGLDATQQKCLDAELDDATVRQLLIDTIVVGFPGEETASELDRIESTCKLG